MRFRRLPAPVRVGLYLLGCVLASLLWCVLLFILLRPGPDVWVDPSRYPVAQNLYLVGTYGIFVGGALWVWLGWQGGTLARLGLGNARRAPAAFAAGLAWGLGSLAGLFALEVALGWVTWGALAWEHTPASVLGLNLATALFFGLSEELLFRGYVLQTLRRGLGPIKAAVLSAFGYAAVHFLRVDLHFTQLVLPFTGLFLAGLMLAWTVLSTRAIWFAAGLHGGWVYLFLLTDRQHLLGYPAQSSWLTGGGYPLGGWVGLMLVSVLWALLMPVLRGRRRPAA